MLFHNPPRQVLDAFLRLQMDSGFQEILKWLYDCMILEALNATKIDNERERNWVDGKVQAMENILKISNESRDRIEKMGTVPLESKKTGSY